MRTGLYTTPEDGIYLVYYQQYINYSYASDIDIVINLSGNEVTLSRYHFSNTNYIETMSCMAVTEAHQGEAFTFNIKNTNAVSLTSNNDPRISYGLVIRLR